jgi:hypothetical protein
MCQYTDGANQINSVLLLRRQIWTIFFCLRKSSEIIFFYLHFIWLYSLWNHQTYWKYDSWFSSELSKLTLVFCHWNDAFSGMKKLILTNNNVISFDPINTSYLTDSYISFTLKLKSWKKICSNRSIRSSTYGKKNFEIPPCGNMVFFITEFVIFLNTSK